MEWLISRKQLLNVGLRWSILLIAGLLVSIFLSTLAQSTSVHAADVTWDNRDLTYNEEKYTRLTDNNKVKRLNIPSGSIVFLHEDNNKKEYKVIYFPSGDITSLSSATHVAYKFTPPDTYEQTSTSTVSIESPSSDSGSTSCDVQ